jgi:tetratricopeptide (TPR) repeat protein
MAHNLEPRNIKTIIEIALLFIDQRKYDAAIKIIELGLSYEKNNTEILSTLGLIHQAQNNFQTALSIYDNLLSSSEN